MKDLILDKVKHKINNIYNLEHLDSEFSIEGNMEYTESIDFESKYNITVISDDTDTVFIFTDCTIFKDESNANQYTFKSPKYGELLYNKDWRKRKINSVLKDN